MENRQKNRLEALTYFDSPIYYFIFSCINILRLRLGKAKHKHTFRYRLLRYRFLKKIFYTFEKIGMNLGMNWNQFVKNEYITTVNNMYIREKRECLFFHSFLHIPSFPPFPPILDI